jgi:hypothetical protein
MSTDVGKAEVEHDHIWLDARYFTLSSAAGGGLDDLVAVCGEARPKKTPNRRFVIDHQHSYGGMGHAT